jgi:hypothetical protein
MEENLQALDRRQNLARRDACSAQILPVTQVASQLAQGIVNDAIQNRS